MFTKTNNYTDKYSKKVISINDLVELVKNNPQKYLIERLREVEYKSSEYTSLKSKLNCITPHGTFNKIENDGLVKLSGYLYYDIDNFETEKQLTETISRLINEFPISFLQRTVSNKGIHFLIKYETEKQLTETFIDIHKYVYSLLLDKGFKCDKNATGLSRRMIISSDDNVYVNNKVSLGINLVSVNTFIDNLNRSNILKVNNKIIKKYNTKPTETFEIIPSDILFKEINIKSKYTDKIENDYIIEDKEFYFLAIPRTIKDGTKHSLYTRLINGLYYLNPNINRNQIFSYLYYVNSRAEPSMSINQLKNLVTYICDNIEETGEIKIKTKIKKIHFNMESKLTKEQKQSIGAKVKAILTKNKTITKIKEAQEMLLKQNIEPKQIKVVEMTGLSKSSVSRYWNCELESLDNIKPKEIKEFEIKNTIEEETFFEELKDIVKHKYKGFEEVSIERTIEDKETFKSVLKQIQNEFGDISEDLLMGHLKEWDRYKIDYYYSNWRKKMESRELFN
jgi:hypothetical protein